MSIDVLSGAMSAWRVGNNMRAQRGLGTRMDIVLPEVNVNEGNDRHPRLPFTPPGTSLIFILPRCHFKKKVFIGRAKTGANRLESL